MNSMHCYSDPRNGAECCSECICFSACLFVCCQTLPSFVAVRLVMFILYHKCHCDRLLYSKIVTFHFVFYKLKSVIDMSTGLHLYAGYVTSPFVSEKPATHALVFILHGLTAPWKQTVAYYFTPDSMPGITLWQVLM